LDCIRWDCAVDIFDEKIKMALNGLEVSNQTRANFTTFLRVRFTFISHSKKQRNTPTSNLSKKLPALSDYTDVAFSIGAVVL